jgi:hypothetical protein
MAQKRFGPTRGAGVTIIELEGEKSVEPGALGWCAYAGVLNRGPVGQLITAQNKTLFKSMCGSRDPDSLMPDACEDYYDNAAGAGGLYLVRVTDGNELQAYATLYARNPANDPSGSRKLTPMGMLRAHNGGNWGGRLHRYTSDMTAGTDLDDTTLLTDLTDMKVDEWKGGFLELAELPGVRFPIVGNDADEIFVAGDQTMKQQWDASGGGDLRYYVTRENEGLAVSYLIEDGEENPNTEFALSIFINGELMKKYANLSVDPNSTRFWEDTINNDDANFWVEAQHTWTGSSTARVRPASIYGEIDTVTALVLNAVIHDYTINSVTGGDPTFALGTTDDTMVAQKLTLTYTGVGAFDVVSDKFGALGSGTEGVLFTPNNKWSPPFTVTLGVTPMAIGESLIINYFPLVPGALAGGFVYPDKVNAGDVRFRIESNDHDSITAVPGSDLTGDGAAGEEFMVVAALEMEGGRDGNSELLDADFQQQAFDVGSSPFNKIFGKNAGLVKVATPGVGSTAVSKTMVAYAAARNYQARYEIPSIITTDTGAYNHVNNTLGRSDYAVVAFPSYGYKAHPDATEPGALKLVCLTGQIHGREAAFSRDYNGYHKAAAGQDAFLPHTLKTTITDAAGEDRAFDEETLNPTGIAVIKKVKGNYVIWGDRTLFLDPTWKWKHQREQMSYYENVLRENFDWIVFAINDPVTEKLAYAALRSFFEPEWVKRALRGETFEQAAIIKIDGENNTDATRANGDMFADIKLRLADTVERFIIRIGKQGIFDAAA